MKINRITTLLRRGHVCGRRSIAMMGCVLAITVSCKHASELQYVDPEIGGASTLLQPTRPTVHIPNKMIRWTPMRTDLLDECIRDFPLTMTSHRLESVFGFLPLTGIPDDGSVWKCHQICDNETNTPYSYQAVLEGCRIRFCPSERSGMIEVEFDGDCPDRILRLNALNGDGTFTINTPSSLFGEETFHDMKAYCYIEGDVPFTVVDNGLEEPGSGHINGKNGILLRPQTNKVKLRYAISYISKEQAVTNLRKEINGWNIERVQEKARDSWKAALGKIEVKGGSQRDLRVFHTALYRCYERPVDISEYGTYYSAFDHSLHPGSYFFTDNWIWDTHLALEPLHMILNPRQEEQKLQSYVEMYRQCGTVPSFAVIWGDWPAMTGNYVAVWMADARSKGLKFDLEGIYEGLKDNSLESTLLPWRNGAKTVLDDFYNKKGWYPALHPEERETVDEVNMPWERRQAVSLSTAFSYADWATAQLARELGRNDDEALFLDRAAYYRNVYRKDKGMFWPRDDKGQWIENVDPRYMDRAYYTENNAYTFQWDVKHDLEGLFELMGGRAEAEKKLDDLFHIMIDLPKYEFYHILPDATGMVGQFAMGNEPSFHIPYIYNYIGQPWKTQKHVRRLIDMMFSDSVYGIPGDEDGGGMSAFIVFSMMGFFQVCPGIPVYAIGCPFFEKTSISLPDGKRFVIKAPGASRNNKYIQSAKLNGKPLDRSWFTHEELLSGGLLELEMGTTANREWGRKNLPPSSINYGKETKNL